MEKLTREQAVVITGYTDVLICDFGDFHRDVEKRLGHPVFTHELPSLSDQIKQLYKEDFLTLLPEKK